MAEEGTLCINADVLKLAGVNASSTSIAEAYTNVYIKMAEGSLSASARYNWVLNYASVSTIGREILRNATAAFAAFLAVDYSPLNFPTSQYTIKQNNLWAMFQKSITLLEKDNNYKEFILSGIGVIA